MSVLEPGEMEPIVVFLDTQAVQEQNFQYERGLLAAFGQHVRAGRVRHLITDVTLDEVKARMDAEIETARAALRTFQRQARILRNSRSSNIARRFRPFSRRETRRELRGQLQEWIASNRTVVLEVNAVEPRRVFDRYFRQQPPFSDGKKKYEFPDAFVMEALRAYAESGDIRITVVSRDPDWGKFVDNEARFALVPGLDQLLADLQEDSSLLGSAQQAVAVLGEEIKAAVWNECEGFQFYVADGAAVVLDPMVANVTLRDPQVIDVTDQSLIVTLQASIEFDVAVDYIEMPRIHAPSWRVPGPIAVRRAPDSEDEPTVLQAYETFTVVAIIGWKHGTEGTQELLGVNVIDPRPVPLYYDEYAES